MREKIFISQRGRERLMSEFGLSASSASMILNFRNNGERSRRIRSKSVNFYGGIFSLNCVEGFSQFTAR